VLRQGAGNDARWRPPSAQGERAISRAPRTLSLLAGEFTGELGSPTGAATHRVTFTLFGPGTEVRVALEVPERSARSRVSEALGYPELAADR
jgi:hypothetical protein